MEEVYAMLPTFDFFNIIRKAVQIGGRAFINPVAWSVALAGAVGIAMTALTDFSKTVVIGNLGVDFDAIKSHLTQGNDLSQFLGYTLALDVACQVLVTLFTCFWTFLKTFPPVFLTFLGSLWVFRKASLIRKAWQSLTQ